MGPAQKTHLQAQAARGTGLLAAVTGFETSKVKVTLTARVLAQVAAQRLLAQHELSATNSTALSNEDYDDNSVDSATVGST